MKKIWDLIRSQSFMAIVAIFGFAFAIYQTYFYERRGEATITLTPPAKLLDIRKAVGGLEVSYAGENLRDSKKTLWVVSATIRNDGNAEIKKGDFDDNDLIGFGVTDGKIVDTPSLRTSVSYLQKNLTLTQTENKITMSSAIIEPNDAIFISFLVLGDENSKPVISPLGKIAGSPALKFSSAEDVQRNSLFDSVVGSDRWWIQPFRMVFYFIAFIATVAVVGSLIAGCANLIGRIKEKRRKDIRREHIDKYKQEQSFAREARTLALIYVSASEKAIRKIFKILNILKGRASLRQRLAAEYPGEELEWIAERCFRIPSYMRIFLEELAAFGFSVSDNATVDDINKWLIELTELAKYLDVNLESDYQLDLDVDSSIEALLIENDLEIEASTPFKDR